MYKLHNIDFHADIYDKLKIFIKEKNIETSQRGIHFGNYCLINIPDDIKKEILKKFENDIIADKIQYRNCKTIIEEADLNTFKEGDKITIEYLETDFFPVTNQKGTVYKKENNYLTIRAYRSQRKGWNIYSGTNCKIIKGW